MFYVNVIFWITIQKCALYTAVSTKVVQKSVKAYATISKGSLGNFSDYLSALSRMLVCFFGQSLSKQLYASLNTSALYEPIVIVFAQRLLEFFAGVLIFASNLVPRVFRLFGQRGNAGKTLGTSKKFIFLIGCSVTVSIVLPQKSCDNKIRCPQSLPGVAPLTKKPEDSGTRLICEGNFFPLFV